MGMIPIALAIAGFVLLWIIVNYHSLSGRRTHIVSLQTNRENLLNMYISLAKQLSALLLIYGIQTPAYLVSLANESGQKLDGARFRKALGEIKSQAENNTDVYNNPDYQEILRQVEQTAGQLLKNQQLLLTEINAYNQQATRMPYRIVAQLFGFTKITSPIV